MCRSHASWPRVSVLNPVASFDEPIFDLAYDAENRLTEVKFTIKVDGEKASDVTAASTETSAAFEHLDLPDGPHKIEVVVNAGTVRLFELYELWVENY